MMNNNVYIIAEAGVNHNGDLKKAFQLIDIAKTSGANAIKFQLFTADKLVTKHAKKAQYQINNTSNEKQYNMLKKLELPKKNYIDLFNYSKKKKIDFLCTAFDHFNLKFLVKKKLINTLKIASGEITNAPLLLNHAKMNCSIILSTGMSNIIEIEEALGVLAYGFLNKRSYKKPSIKKFRESFNSDEGKAILKKKVTLLHCTTEYPAPKKDLNLKSIISMKNYFKLNIGYSDHSKGVDASSIAVLLGAKIIEKHFTIDKKLPGPDHKASLEPDELRKFINQIRICEKTGNNQLKEKLNNFKNIKAILGDGQKKIQKSELKNINIARKYIVAKKDISPGELFSKENIDCKRSAKGLSPMYYWELIGTKSKKKYFKDDNII